MGTTGKNVFMHLREVRMSLSGFSRIHGHLDIFFYNNARTQFHENLTYCLVADTMSYTRGLTDKHCLHIGCSFSTSQ